MSRVHVAALRRSARWEQKGEPNETSHISSSVGVSPGSAITGFPPGTVMNGSLHANDATAMQAHADLAAAYTAFAGLASPPANNLTGTDLGGLTLTPGVYRYNVAATWSSGTLTFDAQNDLSARFVIQIGTTLITSSSSSVVLINGADPTEYLFSSRHLRDPWQWQ